MIPGQVPGGRFRLALGLSVLAHVLLAGSWGGGGGGTVVLQGPLQARLDAAPAMASDAVFADEPVAATMRVQPERSRTGGDRPVPAAAVPGSDAAGADPRFYLARELDQYPAAPELGQAAAVAHVRVWVGIDQQGRVVDVAPADPGHPVADVRERLLAVRFVPARKDGRPVKSRVLMEWPER